MRTVSGRAIELGTRFRAENEALIAFVEAMDEREWSIACAGEGRPAGVVVQHIAEGHRIIGGILRAMAAGRGLPAQAWTTAEQGAVVNARQARRLEGKTREDGLRLLRSNTERMARFIESLDDADLRREAIGVAGLTVQDSIERGLMGHLQGHAQAVRRTVVENRAAPRGQSVSG